MTLKEMVDVLKEVLEKTDDEELKKKVKKMLLELFKIQALLKNFLK